MSRRNTIEDFWNSTSPEPNTGCWLWTGMFQDERGYPRFAMQGKIYRAHRLAYELVKGSIPEGKEINHLCRVRACVNPDHLEVTTHAENCAYSKYIHRSSHCRYGHPYSGGNLYIRPDGSQGCRECRRQAGLRYRPLKGTGNKGKTHCKRGHPLSGYNLIAEEKDGKMKRRCRECVNERQRRHQAKKRTK